MSEIKAKRWRLKGQTSIPHLFAGDSKTALCGQPNRNLGQEREWLDVPDADWVAICWKCRREHNKRRAAAG